MFIDKFYLSLAWPHMLCSLLVYSLGTDTDRVPEGIIIIKSALDGHLIPPFPSHQRDHKPLRVEQHTTKGNGDGERARGQKKGS